VPVKIEMLDLVYVSLISFVFALLSTVYPSINASKTKPAEILKGN
jgi:lipoprotein-releasing system permease protein